MSVALSRRQQILYLDKCAIFRAVQQFNSDGVAAGTGYQLANASAPCHFEIRPNIDTESAVGRFQMDQVFTLDLLHVAEFEECGPDYVVRNLTLDPDGSKSINWGLFWIVRGPARSISTRGRRHAGKREFRIFLLAEPPVGLP